jgi:hypothetical protein
MGHRPTSSAKEFSAKERKFEARKIEKMRAIYAYWCRTHGTSMPRAKHQENE